MGSTIFEVLPLHSISLISTHLMTRRIILNNGLWSHMKPFSYTSFDLSDYKANDQRNDKNSVQGKYASQGLIYCYLLHTNEDF